MFGEWKVWQIVLMAIFGSMWVVLTIVDLRRKAAAKKREQEKREKLKAAGYTAEQIDEILRNRNHPAHKDLYGTGATTKACEYIRKAMNENE